MLRLTIILALMLSMMPVGAAASNRNDVAAGVLLGAIVGGVLVNRANRAHAAPVYVHPAPVYVHPAPVYVHPAPVYVAPRVCRTYEETVVTHSTVYVNQIDECTGRVLHQQRYFRH